MRPLLIADRNPQVKTRLSQLFTRKGLRVVAVDSVEDALRIILKSHPQVLLLGSDLEAMPLVKLIQLFRSCSPQMAIILVSDTASLPQIRACRREGIFYHSLCPTDGAGEEELLQAVRCAFLRTRNMAASGFGTFELNPIH